MNYAATVYIFSIRYSSSCRGSIGDTVKLKVYIALGTTSLIEVAGGVTLVLADVRAVVIMLVVIVATVHVLVVLISARGYFTKGHDQKS